MLECTPVLDVEYSDKKGACLCSLDAAVADIGQSGLNNEVRGLWSVIKVNLRPYKYWWNRLTPQATAKASLSICE